LFISLFLYFLKRERIQKEEYKTRKVKNRVQETKVYLMILSLTVIAFDEKKTLFLDVDIRSNMRERQNIFPVDSPDYIF